LKRENRRGFRNADEYWNAMTYVVKSFNWQENYSMFVLYLGFRFNNNLMLSVTHLNSSSQLSNCLDHISQNLLSCWRYELDHVILSHTFPEFIMFILSTAIYDDSGEMVKQPWINVDHLSIRASSTIIPNLIGKPLVAKVSRLGIRCNWAIIHESRRHG
jgi:hypothetical protein